jgi:DNA-binding MarR family transcriptional regulator
VSGRPDDVDAHEAYVRLEREIGLLLRRSRAISARLAGELHPDLDGAAYGLLALLQDIGPLRASDLVARLGLDKSTVSRQVASLVDLGLVDRAADPVDGRAQVLTPSPEGAARLQRIRDVRRARWEADLSDWPAADVATLADLLRRLNGIGEAREAEVGDRPTR